MCHTRPLAILVEMAAEGGASVMAWAFVPWNAKLLVLENATPPEREVGCLGTEAARCLLPPRETYGFTDRRCRIGLRWDECSAMAA